MSERLVKVFALTTCGFCRRVKAFLRKREISFQEVDVDLLSGEERKQALEELRSVNPRRSFPTVVIGDQVIVGFRKAEIERALDVED